MRNQSRRFFASTQTNDDLQGHGSRLEGDLPCPVYFFKAHNLLRHTYITNLLYAGVDPKTVQYLAGHENIEYYTIANQKQARYNIDKKTKATATVQKIDFGCSHKEQIENRYPQWLKTQMCDACSKLFV